VYSRITGEKEQEPLNAPVHTQQPYADGTEPESKRGKKAEGWPGF
jgi:hypothetical protein